MPLRLEPGETLVPGCLNAEVSVGEQRLPADALQLSVEHSDAGSRLRLRSTVVVLEPLVSVNVVVGCNGSVARQFVVFADPPGHRAEPVVTAAASDSAMEPSRTAPIAQIATAPSVRARTPNAGASAAARPAKAVLSTRNSGTGKPRASTTAAAPEKKLRKVSVIAAGSAAPRLKLDEPDELLLAAKLAVATRDAAIASAENVASAAQAAASAAEGRLLALEKDLQALRADSMAQRDAMAQMRNRVASAEQQSQWTGPLMALLVLLAGLTLWLALRLRALQRERQAGWWQVARSPEAETEVAAEAEAATPDESPVATPVPTGPITAADAEELFGTAMAEPAPDRPLSVEELIDLEQQADFFVVLGEDASAIDLLMTHLRGSGGVSPLPYLKLLEIYRRGADHDAYERIRKRFNQRFNAVAPSWEDDLQRGRSLQDYPSVVAALQAAWPQPLDAMAELETLLFRKQAGELFELPAYRDVLSLYAVARDLHRHVDDDSHDVDVLLPLGLAHEHDVTARLSIFDRLDAVPNVSTTATEDRPTAPIDLDLSEPDPVPAEHIELRAPVRKLRRRGA